jgi:predicted small lipoprotein YifL
LNLRRCGASWLLTMLLGALEACGQMGPLYLPGERDPADTSGAPPASNPASERIDTEGATGGATPPGDDTDATGERDEERDDVGGDGMTRRAGSSGSGSERMVYA